MSAASLFEGPMGLDLFAAFCEGWKVDNRRVRHRMLKGARTKTPNSFAKHRDFIIKNSSSLFIKNFMKEHWKVINDLSARDMALIASKYDSIETAATEGLSSCDHHYD